MISNPRQWFLSLTLLGSPLIGCVPLDKPVNQSLEYPPLSRLSDTCMESKRLLNGSDSTISDSLQKRNLWVQGKDSIYFYQLSGGCQLTELTRVKY